MNSRSYLLVGLGLVLAAPAQAATNPLCSSLQNPIYVTGSSAIEPFLIGIAVPLQDAATAYTIVYNKKGSCTGVDAIVNGTLLTGTATYYDSNGDAASCDLPAEGQPADIGVSDVFAKTCTGQEPPSDIADFWGPNQAMLIVVSKASTAQGITWEQVHMLFGYGEAAEVAPWLDNNSIYHRNDQSGTQQMVSYATDLPASVWLGTSTPDSGEDGPYDAGGSGGVRDGVSAADATGIGILGADVYDTARDTLSALAFKGKGQLFAYYPDSTPTSFDKRNVRDGHYLIWGPVHMLAQVSSGGEPVNPSAKVLIDIIQGKQSLAGADVVSIAIASHVVPDCAMTVQRSSEVGPLSPYTPEAPCACYFDAHTDGTTSCATCSDPDGTACAGGGVCRRGYCEAN